MVNYLALILSFLSIFILIELLLHFFLARLRARFGNIIIAGKDNLPAIDKEGLAKFMKIGYDPELGWVRKPNTSKKEKSSLGASEYHINALGSRTNPGHEKLPIIVDTFGDSYTFGRQINDNETWQYFLAKSLKCNVTNFGVGNYGLDQAYLRFKREMPRLNGSIVIIGIVPETIRRNLSVWKHYFEFGNTFGFKPRFVMADGNLQLIPNCISSEQEFFRIKEHLSEIRKNDYFYKNKFRKYIFTFPYTFSLLRNFRLKMPLLFYYGGAYILETLKINWKKSRASLTVKSKVAFDLKDKISYYQKKELLELTLKILEVFAQDVRSKKMVPVFVILPEYDDLEYIRKTGDVFYDSLLKPASGLMDVLDLGKELLKIDKLEGIFSNKDYGGHYNSKGNEIVGEAIYRYLVQRRILNNKNYRKKHLCATSIDEEVFS